MGPRYEKSENLQEAEKAAHGDDAGYMMKSVSFSLASIAESFERLVLTIETGTLSHNVSVDIDSFPRNDYLRVDKA